MINNKKVHSILTILCILIFVSSILVGVDIYFCSTKKKPEKEFVRYYLSHEQATINVMVQWKNHPDTIAFSTFDPQQAIWVLNQLQKTNANKVITIPKKRIGNEEISKNNSSL